MIQFKFRVNKSFLTKKSRPITILKSQYAKLEEENLSGRAVIVAPNGQRLPGKVYSGTANWGPYYQLQAEGYDHDPLSKLDIGTYLIVKLKREEGKLIAELLDSVARSERSAEPRPLYEGTPRASTLDVYERNPEARKRCLDHFGVACIVCGFDFGHAYGATAEGFIHVHHLRPIAELGEQHKVDPVADLRPVCPNCHAVLHLKSPPFTVDEVQGMLSDVSPGLNEPKVTTRDALHQAKTRKNLADSDAADALFDDLDLRE